MNPPREWTAGIIGRTLRLLLALLLVWMTYTVMRSEDAAFNLRVVAAFVGLAMLYMLLNALIVRFASTINPWLGAILALVPVTFFFLLGGPVGRVSSVAFVGVSLLLQAIRGDGGCEVMAIPGLVFRRRTHLVCVFFSPIDWIEAQLSGPGGMVE